MSIDLWGQKMGSGMSIDLESLVSSLPEGGDLPARRSASGLPSGIGYYGGGGSAKVGDQGEGFIF